eukprot:TRINITY_DN9867_c0_g2_i2.p1 TRINITY_DN9867_c0_g2~~TRINITY_DN9867_c0_g2_i2.p1  ORF type:complete len:287 (+),score=69.29 TRINITY_DN9867_c0_g2_i2:71-931(+)
MANAESLVSSIVGLDEETAVSVICSVLENRPELAPSVVNFAVPDLTYPPVKAIAERRSQGYIKSFNGDKGFGFIACDELHEVFGNDVFLHSNQLNDFSVGYEVNFAVALNKDNKPQAYDLKEMRGGKGANKGGGGYSAGKGAPPPAKGSYDRAPSYGKGAPPPREAPREQWSSPAGKGKGKPQQSWSSPPEKRKFEDAKDFNVDDAKVLGDYNGFIKSFNDKNGYGFISCDDLKADGYNNDCFLHHAQLGGFEVGAEVLFTAFLNGKGQPQAKNLRAVGGAKRPRT